MTYCTPTPMPFASLNRKKIEASFSGGNITSDGGLLLLREVDKKIGLTKSLSKVITDDRDASYVDHSIEHMLRQRVYGIAAGYEDVDDHKTLRNDSFFQVMVGKEVPLASTSTLSRFENNVDRRSLVEMSKQFVEHFIARHKTPPKELILDVDPTDNEIYGKQEQRSYHGYYKHYCFLPLHVFCGPHLLVSFLRRSNIDGAKYSAAILKLLVKRLREAWPNVSIIFRGDCAFSRQKIVHWCDNNDVKFIVGLGGNARLKDKAKNIIEIAKKQYELTHEKQRLFSDFEYAAKSWKYSRRVVVKVEHHDNGENIRFIMSNINLPAQTLYDEGYCPRGDMENGIKQLKLDLYSDRNSCTKFLANQFRLLLSSIAYILIIELQLTHLTKTQFLKSYCQTVRTKLFKIGAIVLKNSRRIQILLSSNYPYQSEFNKAAQSLHPT